MSVRGGGPSRNRLVLNNGDTVIELFQGMFEGQRLTFHPGWVSRARNLPDFVGIRDSRHIQKTLKAQQRCQIQPLHPRRRRPLPDAATAP